MSLSVEILPGSHDLTVTYKYGNDVDSYNFYFDNSEFITLEIQSVPKHYTKHLS